MIAALLLGALALASATPPPAPSPTPAEDWTVVTCDGNLTVDYEKNLVTFYRNALIKNPRGTLRSEKLVIHFSDRGKTVEKAEALGGVTVEMGQRRGRSDTVVYYPQEKKVVMSGQATISQAEGEVRGETITFFLDRQEMRVEGAPGVNVVPEKDVEIGF